jgi:glucose/arabinose dehydrogenase
MHRSTLVLIALTASACFGMRSSRGGGEARLTSGVYMRPSDVELPKGYRIEPVADGLTFPSAIAFDDQNRPYVVEAGYSYGETFLTPRVVRLEGGRQVPIATGDNPPWTGIAAHAGKLYLAEGGVVHGGRIVELGLDGSRHVLIEGLPSFGDHHTNGPAIGPDGALYFGQGTATNSAIVGSDNEQYGWLERHPEFHDVPCKDVVLRGVNIADTGAFVPKGTRTEKGQRIQGRVPCSGAIMRIPITGGAPQLVAWGMRNPFGLAFGPDGQLYVTDNAFDERGSRPVFGTGDLLWRIDPTRPPRFFGWPDFSGGRSLADEDRFKPPHRPAPELLLEDPEPPASPVSLFAVHASADGLDFSRNADFGYVGNAFIAEFGDMAPTVGKVLSPVGFKVVRVDPTNGVVRDFAINRGKMNGPASRLEKGGLERPVSVRFDRAGTSLYVVDFGIIHMTENGPQPKPGTGRVWRIRKEGSS